MTGTRYRKPRNTLPRSSPLRAVAGWVVVVVACIVCALLADAAEPARSTRSGVVWSSAQPVSTPVRMTPVVPVPGGARDRWQKAGSVRPPVPLSSSTPIAPTRHESVPVGGLIPLPSTGLPPLPAIPGVVQAPTIPTVPSVPALPPPTLTPPTPPLPEAPAPSGLPPSVGLPLPRIVPRNALEPGRTGPEASETPADPNAVTNAAVLLASARNAVNQGNLSLAIERFQSYLRLKPDDAEAREELAGVYFQADRPEDVVRVYEELVRRNPRKSAQYQIALSSAALRLRQYEAAVCRLQDAIALTMDTSIPGNRRLRFAAASRLGQVFLIQNQYPKAAEILKQLAALPVDDEDLPAEYVDFLLDLEKPAEALKYIASLLEVDPENAQVLTAQVRAYALLGDRPRAFQVLSTLPEKIPKDVDERLGLAQALIPSQDFDLAEAVLGQVAGVRPTSVSYQLISAEALIRQYRLAQAKVTIAAIRPTSRLQDRDLALTRAGYHIAAGEYIQAKLIYTTLLRADPFDAAVHFNLGDLYLVLAEYEKAKAEYAKIPQTEPVWRAARRGLATTLATQHRFPEALDILDDLFRCAAWDAQTVAVFLQVLTDSGDCDRAAEIGRGYRNAGPPTRSADATARAALGHALLDCGKLLEAEQQFVAALTLSYKKSISAMYGMMRLGLRNGEPCRFPPVSVADQPFDELRVRMEMIDLFAGDHDDQYALEFALAAIKLDPQNVAAMIRMAEAQQRIARQSGKIIEAVQACKAVLMISPTNNRGLLALARVLAIGRDFPAAAETYQQIIALDQDLTVPKREVALVYYGDHQYPAAHAAYRSVSFPDPDTEFRQSVQAIAAKAPQVLMAVEGLTAGPLPGPKLRSELGKVLSVCPDPVMAAGLQNAALDYEARMAEIKGAELEDRAGEHLGLRNLTAIPMYQQLLDYEPANAGAMFSLGQIYSGRKDTDAALATYSRLLAVDPQFREASVATDRAKAEASPTYTGTLSYEDEFGRNQLVNMRRFRFSNLFTVPIGDENEYVGLGYSRVEYSPGGARTLSGNIPTFVYQQKLPYYEPLLFRSVLNIEQYPDRLSTRPTFDTGFQYNGDGVFAETAMALENVIQNSESLRQDIYRLGGRVSANYQHTRRLSFGGLYRYAYYSDDNNLNEVNLNTAYLLCYAPQQLRVILSVNNMFYSDQTVFGPFNPSSLVGTIHPYFAPSSFTYYEARLDYTEYCCRDFFAHSNTLYYNLQYALGWDNHFNAYNTVRAALNYDYRSWLTVGVDGRYQYSPVYQFGSINAYLIWRMPFCPRF